MTTKKPPVLVAMSGGVDSSAAAILLRDAGHPVTGVTMKLWGGEQDSGCCSVADVDDARRAADFLGIDHHVFNFGEEFEEHVVTPYVEAHAAGRTPNPCIECNRHLKFDKLFRRATALGFDLVATGHHAQIGTDAAGRKFISRGADDNKDQSYVLHMLTAEQLDRLVLPIGHMSKDMVRAKAAEVGLATANKPDSQDVCFITATGGGRQKFLGDRLTLTPGVVVDATGAQVAEVPAVELVTIGQRKGLGVSGQGEPAYAVDISIPEARVTIGRKDQLLCDHTELQDLQWVYDAVPGLVEGQSAAHGPLHTGTVVTSGGVVTVEWAKPRERVAAGQAVVFYQGDHVVGGAMAT